MIRANIQVLRVGAMVAIADFRAIYTWRTWLFAWLSRILCQVAFFAFIGRLVRSAFLVHYLAIGNSVYIVTMITMSVCVSAAWERNAGTLPLLIASPAALLTIFIGRGINWLIDGTACASIALLGLGPLFHIPMPWPQALLSVPLIACTGASTYCLGLVLSGIVLRHLDLRNIVAALGYLALMLLCGVEVPVSALPRPFRLAADALPLTHGLAAIRSLLAGGSLPAVLRQAGLELAVAAAWLLVAVLVFWRFAEAGRKNGKIEFGG